MTDWDYASNVWGGLSHIFYGYTKKGNNDNILPIVVIPHYNVEIELSCSGSGNSSSTFIKSEFKPINPFKFSITPKSINSSVVIKVDLPVQKTGDNNLDQNYLVRASNRPKLLQLLANDIVKESIDSKLCHVYFGLQNQPNGNYQLLFYDTQVIYDQQKLESLINLFKTTLDLLEEMKVMTCH